MNRKFPLCFEMSLKQNAFNPQNTLHNYDYETFLNSLVRVCRKLTFSLRYLYDPSSERRLRLFILINSQEESEGDESCLKIFSLVTRGNLSRLLVFDYQNDGFPALNWVTSIGEISKYSEFLEKPDFTGYLPHLFETSLSNNHFSLVELLDGASYEKLVLEITLKTYNSPKEQALWSKAIDDLVDRLGNSGTKNSSVKHGLNLYRKYQDGYSRNQLFNYSIKALGEDRGDAFAILHTLLEVVSKTGVRQKTNPIVTFNSDDPRFLDSLQATRSVHLSKDVEWDGWKEEPGKSLQHKLIKETISSAGLLKSLDDGSLNFPIVPSNFNATRQPNLSFPSDENLSSSELTQEDLVRGSSLALSRIYKSSLPKVEHLKPLNQIVTYAEVNGFLKIFSLRDVDESVDRLMLSIPISAEDIFNKHRSLITKDTYVVGTDDSGNPVTSSWAEIPHRLVAGLPGAGKTNFLNWIIFQFLYVNPRRKIYISDFGGVDFQHLNRIGLNAEIVTTPEDCPSFAERIHKEEYERRLQLMQSYGVSDLKLLQGEGVDIDRTLWVIDEAADIADVSSKLRDATERRLKEYARKGRKYGIHVLYCTQRPTVEVITKQVLDQCEEKVVFRVTSNTSERVLDDTIAGNIPKDARGRAWLDGYFGKLFVNVPKMEKPEGSTIPISETLWRYCTVEQ